MTASRQAKKHSSEPRARTARAVYPFAAIVGQEQMKLALLLSVIEPAVGGVLVMGHRGTGKSTAVRALADLLPPVAAVRGCVYNCDPEDQAELCGDCAARLAAEARLPRERRGVPAVELPLGATEDRVCGTVDIERALRDGTKAFEPGLLARANRGFLYVDEVNLLEDHLVDLLLDAAATGRNRVEREGVSAEHPARFVLVGSGNPEEGELRPQLLDRFGLFVEVRTTEDPEERVRVVERREAFERDPSGFVESLSAEQASLRRRIVRARRSARAVAVPRPLLRQIARLCAGLGVDGHRGELTITRAARALAAFEGRRAASAEDVRRVAAMALRHRLRRDPLEQSDGGARIGQGLAEFFGAGQEGQNADAQRAGGEPRANPATSGADSSHGGRRGGAESDGGPSVVEAERAAGGGGSERVVPPAQAAMPEVAAPKDVHGKIAGRNQNLTRGRGGRRAAGESSRGRYVSASPGDGGGGVVALDATLRVAAPLQVARGRDFQNASPLRIGAGDLRYKKFRRKSGRLYILAVDASGSMAVNRVGQAKGALTHLLRRSYVNRDRVALVSFRERDGEVLLRPCASAARAQRILEALPVGGATPLAAGLLRALEVTRRSRAEGVRGVSLYVFTDGRANVPLGVGGAGNARQRIRAEIERLGLLLQHEGVESVVVDTRNRFTGDGGGRALADALGGRHVHLPPTSRRLPAQQT